MTDSNGPFAHDGLFGDLFNGRLNAYALLYRPESNLEHVELLTGTLTTATYLQDIPACYQPGVTARSEKELLAIVPYRQISERGFECVDDQEPLYVMAVDATERLSKDVLIETIADHPIELIDGHFDSDDQAYAETALRIIQQEIGKGAGANFVLKRSYVASIANYSRASLLSLYRRLLLQSAGAYWVFLVDLGDRVLIGATPERHVSLNEGVATMNPISGTYRYPATGPSIDDLLKFLADTKEREELFMVVDEELKMMGRVCPQGATLRGPYLKPMARLAHTEYLISGSTDLPPWRILRETLFAPTITGSPLENACRVISKYEPEGRGYYSGLIALFGRNAADQDIMDSAILIRTADIDAQGTLRLSTGATLVRDSSPLSEAAETWSKAAGMLSALGALPEQRVSPITGCTHADSVAHMTHDPRVVEALQRRNAAISHYWQVPSMQRDRHHSRLKGRSVLVLDAEDTFTAMICHQLSSFGLQVTVVNAATHIDPRGFDLVVLGPGPGDPNDSTDVRVSSLQKTTQRLLLEGRPFLAICLSHQILCRHLGLAVVRKQRPNQGTQKRIDLFGEPAHVGFYNTYSASSLVSTVEVSKGAYAHLSRDSLTGEVHAMQGPSFRSFQFHPESILTLHGDRILGEAAAALLS